MDTLSTLIASKKLTKNQRIIANYILDHESEATFQTSIQMAEAVGVSEATIIRFARALGFSGFIELKKMLRNEYHEKVSYIPDSITVPSQRVVRQQLLQDDQSNVLTYYDNSLNNLNKLIENVPSQEIDEVARIIAESRWRYIAGTRSDSGISQYFNLYMKQMFKHVAYVSQMGVSPFDYLYEITERDCLIIFSFPRYAEIDKLVAQAAREAGAEVIVITDRNSSELAQYATHLLAVPVDSNTFFNSMVAPQLLTEALLAAISKRVPNIKGRLQKIDKYLDIMGNY